MLIGERLRALRKEKKMSQGEIEEKTGLLRCYISRVENGHTVPSIETLEKMARALSVPMYYFFYDGDEPPQPLPITRKSGTAEEQWGFSGKWAAFLSRMRSLLGNMKENDRKLLLLLAFKMARKNKV